MLSRGDAVVYKCRGVYKVEEVGKLDFSFVDGKKDYYTLQSIDNQRDKAYVPIDDDKNIRRPVSEQKAKELLDHLAEVGILNVKNEKYREQEYKDCISSFCPENWVKVLKTLYSRTKRRGSMTSMRHRENHRNRKNTRTPSFHIRKTPPLVVGVVSSAGAFPR